jgi:hypothetical protein
MFAARHGTAEAVDLLIEKGASVNATDVHHATSLHKACITDVDSVAKIRSLVHANADLEAVDRYGMTPLRACDRCAPPADRSSPLSLVRLQQLVHPRLVADLSTTRASSPLLSPCPSSLLAPPLSLPLLSPCPLVRADVAAFNERLEAIVVLMQLGANHFAKDGPLQDGDTPYQMAQKNGLWSTVEVLKKHEVRRKKINAGLTRLVPADTPYWEPPAFSAKRMNPKGRWGN